MLSDFSISNPGFADEHNAQNGRGVALPQKYIGIGAALRTSLTDKPELPQKHALEQQTKWQARNAAKCDGHHIPAGPDMERS